MRIPMDPGRLRALFDVAFIVKPMYERKKTFCVMIRSVAFSGYRFRVYSLLTLDRMDVS